MPILASVTLKPFITEIEPAMFFGAMDSAEDAGVTTEFTTLLETPEAEVGLNEEPEPEETED